MVKQLQLAIMPNCNIWYGIAILVALHFLYKDFETTNTSIFERGDKTIKKIQQILASAKVKFPSSATFYLLSTMDSNFNS